MHERTTSVACQTGYQPISEQIGFFETSSRGIETLFQSPVRHAPPAVGQHLEKTKNYEN